MDQRTFTCTHTDGSRKPLDVSLLEHVASQAVQQTLKLSPPAPVVVRTLSLCHLLILRAEIVYVSKYWGATPTRLLRHREPIEVVYSA